jgi:hypothetical protein
MTAKVETTGQEAEKKASPRDFLNRLSLRNKVIGIAALVFLALLIFSIPGDHNELLARQERVDAAQIAYDLALPAVLPIMERVKAIIDDTEIDLSDNRLYTGLSSTMTTFNRENVAVASKFQAVVTFHKNVHSLLDDVPELNTDALQPIVVEMDTTLSVAFLALMEMNDSIDAYNGYYSWISAKLAGGLFGLPQGYADPVPARSRLNSTSFE